MQNDPVFPYDILETIIQHFVDISLSEISESLQLSKPSRNTPSSSTLYQDLTRDLITLGTVSSDFARLRRPYLFQNITLDFERSPKQQNRLVELMKTDPLVEISIRHIVFKRRFPEPTYVYPDLGFPLTAAKANVGFPNATELSILGATKVSYEMPPDKIPRFSHAFRNMMDYFMARKCLTKLVLENMLQVPLVSILISQSDLGYLELRDCAVADGGSEGGGDGERKRDAIPGRKLKTFVATGSFDSRAIHALLCCRQLERVDLSKVTTMDSEGQAEPQLPSLKLPAFGNVRELVVSVYVDLDRLLVRNAESRSRAFPRLGDIRVRSDLMTYGMRENGVKGRLVYGQDSEQLIVHGETLLNFFFDVVEPKFATPFSLHSIHISREADRYNDRLITTLCDALDRMKRTNTLSNILINIHLTEGDRSLVEDRDGSMSVAFVDGWKRFDDILVGDEGDFPFLKYVEVCIWMPFRVKKFLPVDRWWGRWAGCKQSEYRTILDEPLKGLIAADDIEVCCGFYLS